MEFFKTWDELRRNNTIDPASGLKNWRTKYGRPQWRKIFEDLKENNEGNYIHIQRGNYVVYKIVYNIIIKSIVLYNYLILFRLYHITYISYTP